MLFSIFIIDPSKIDPILNIGLSIGVSIIKFPLKIALKGIAIVSLKVTEAVILNEKAEVSLSKGYFEVLSILFSNINKFS